jgi:hypothetical protein
MKISLLTDAPKHNLALMKISAWHKMNGDEVLFNTPICSSDYRYASILFDKNIRNFIADEYGGPAIQNSVLSPEVEKMFPDYDLMPVSYSLGYTFRPCFNSCAFCKVPQMSHPDIEHHSIFEFYKPEFKNICILNNNTFQDPLWTETFGEIWDCGLSVIDENGYDLRLIDEEKADALHRTKWASPIHFSWDRMVDEQLIINGLRLLKKHKMCSTSNGVYVIIGYNTTEEEDIYRCQIIDSFGLTPYPMPYIKNKYTQRFKRFINLHYYRSYKNITEAWNSYKD